MREGGLVVGFCILYALSGSSSKIQLCYLTQRAG